MQKLLLVYYHSENRATSQIWKVLPNMFFSPDLGGKNGGVLSMRMQVILDSSFARPGSAPYGAGRKESSGTGLGGCGNYTTQLSDARVVSNKKIIREKIIPQLNAL